METRVKVRYSGPMFAKQMLFADALVRAAGEIAKVVETAAKSKTPVRTGFLYSKFSYNVPSRRLNQVKAVVFNAAPYALYVDQDHKLKNNKMFKGRQFMHYGLEVGREAAGEIIIKEIKK